MSFVNYTSIVEGWLPLDAGTALYNDAMKCPKDLYIVEIGSFKGLSTCYLSNGSKDGNCSKVFAIDPHCGNIEHKIDGQPISTFDEYYNNLTKHGFNNYVTTIKDYSYNVVDQFEDNSIGVLFIDGSHEYEDVKNDFLLYYPKVNSGGVIPMHDCCVGVS